MDITIYHQQIRHKFLEDFNETILDGELTFTASELMNYGFTDRHQIENAIKRAIQTCQVAHIPVRNNFKTIYFSDHGEVTNDWKLSALAKKLIIINADTSIPIVAQTQIKLINKN